MTRDTLAHLLTRMRPDDVDKPMRSESDLRIALIAYLRSNGWEVEERVKCTAGEADLVARQSDLVGIIEIKLALSRRALHEAASQALTYRLAIDPTAEAIVVGYQRPGTSGAVAAVESLGVSVVALKNGYNRLEPNRRIERSAPNHCSPFLQWNVQPFAQSHQITTVSQLVAATGLPKQSLYRLWRGETSQINVQVLGKLCVGLEARPGDWFVWEGEGKDRRLVWNVAVRAQSLDLTATQLAFRASVYYRMVQLVWQGTGQSIFVQTLAKFARALSTEDRPFDLGNLFVWASDEG